MRTENPATIVSQDLDSSDVNISRVTLPSPLKYEDDDTIMDSSEEIELEGDIIIQTEESPKEDMKRSQHYKRLVKNVRDEGMEGCFQLCVKQNFNDLLLSNCWLISEASLFHRPLSWN